MSDAAPQPTTDSGEIAGLLARYRSGETTVESVVAEHLARIDADTTVRAVVERNDDAALEAARALDAESRAGRPLRPLHGVPMTVKASFGVKGLHASVGTPESRVLAEVDAPSVARLRAAGAVILGTTNVPPNLDGFFSDSPLGGRTSNPWDLSRTPGGSSGGSGAAIAAGFSMGELGSDLAGSIRVPAAFNGVVAHRPSQYAISKRGHLPWPLGAHTEPPLSAAGPMARTVADVQRLFEVLVRDDPEAPRIAPARPLRLKGLRVGVWRDEPGAECDPEVDAVLDTFAESLAAAGCALVPIARTVLGTPEAADLFDRLFDAELAFVGSAGRPLGEVWSDWEDQRRIRAEWAETVSNVDVVIAPAVSVVAPLHGALQASAELRARTRRWSAMANLAAVPCTVLPVGFEPGDGMPVAAQVIAPQGRDRRSLHVTGLLEGIGTAPQPRQNSR